MGGDIVDQDTIDNLEQQLTYLEDKLCKVVDKNTQDISSKLKEVYDVPGNDVDNLEPYVCKLSADVYELYGKFVDSGLVTNPGEKERSKLYHYRFSRLIGINHYAIKYANTLKGIVGVMNPNFDYTRIMNVTTMDSMSIIDYSKMSSYQKLLIGIQNKISESGMRKLGEYCMTLKRTDSGYDTRYWQQSEEIGEFCNRVTHRESDYNLWLLASKPPTNITTVISRMSTSNEGFRDVKRDRYLFSYRNGIYETNWRDSNGDPVGKFHPYESKYGGVNPAMIAPDRMACRYFDSPLQEVSDPEAWYSIPTPVFQSILDHQGYGREVCEWMYALVIGRFMYEVGDLDEWQVMPFLIGVANTGKSTICVKVCAKIFDDDDIGVLSNNGEAKFGLSALYDKFGAIAPEIKKNLSLEQTEFQSMISGETVSVAEKFKTAKKVLWKTPIVGAGNEMPGYSDNSGSISRRIVPFEFKKHVTHTNTRLGKMLEDELPALVYKGNMAYLSMVRKYGNIGIWEALPEYFIKTRQAMRARINPILGTLDEYTALNFQEGKSCTLANIMEAYEKRIESLHGSSALHDKRYVWNAERFLETFSDRIELVDGRIYGVEVATLTSINDHRKNLGLAPWLSMDGNTETVEQFVDDSGSVSDNEADSVASGIDD